VLQLEFGSRRLVARWWMAALTLFGVVMFLELGVWQWHRAAEKRAMAAAFALGSAGPAEPLGGRSAAQLARYTQLRVTGRYDAAHQFLLDNMSFGGRTGYEVLTPLRLEDGRLLLVNRGWIELPAGRRDRAPDIDIAVTAPTGRAAPVDIMGRLDTLPVTGLALGRAAPTRDGLWPKRTSFPTMDELEAALGQKLEARQLLLSPDAPDGYGREWHSAAAGFGPERHVAYAIQWWGFAALCLFLFVFMNLEPRP